jgi:hypothetical protein
MIPKISLAAAFVLMVAPPMACASTCSLANQAPMTPRSPLGIVVAQDQDQSSAGTTDSDSDSDSNSDNDSDSNDSADDNQNGDGSQMDQQNSAGDDQPVPPTVLNGNQNDPDDAPQFNQVPQQQQMNPNQ